MCESFFATLECELLELVPLSVPSAESVRLAVFGSHAEGWYNPL